MRAASSTTHQKCTITQLVASIHMGRDSPRQRALSSREIIGASLSRCHCSPGSLDINVLSHVCPLCVPGPHRTHGYPPAPRSALRASTEQFLPSHEHTVIFTVVVIVHKHNKEELMSGEEYQLTTNSSLPPGPLPPPQKLHAAPRPHRIWTQ